MLSSNIVIDLGTINSNIHITSNGDRQMTVNEMLGELRKLQREGRGNETVFQACTDKQNETVWCPRTAQIKKYHSHVVLSPERYLKEWDS